MLPTTNEFDISASGTIMIAVKPILSKKVLTMPPAIRAPAAGFFAYMKNVSENKKWGIRKLQPFFSQIIKNSFVPAIILFAAGYYIANLVEMIILERIPLFFSPQKTLLILFSYIFLWLIFCYIQSWLALKSYLKGQNNHLKQTKKLE